MQAQLPHITQEAYRRNNTEQSHSKRTPKFLISSFKPIRMPFEKSRDFSVRTIDKVPQYNPLKDRYLQQFFRRQQRMKLLSIFSNQTSLENRETIHKIAELNKKKDKSNYQNLINLSQCTVMQKSRTLYKKKSANPEEPIGQRKIKLVTQPNERNSKGRLSVSKDEFNSFLFKAKEKLKLLNSLKDRQNY